ncbi:MAG TPA: hypothetical protein VMY87_10995 [Armatimonadota bacterium]|nr:hypothetical protein [Armatimonadota bacterium]
MARRRGKGSSRPRGRDIYEGLPSDATYKQTAHKRALRNSIRAWVVRLLVVAAIAFAWHLWGDDVRSMMRVQAHETTEEFEEGADQIKEGRDRRAGVGWVEGE